MADRYWVGGTGSWSSSNTTNWSTSSGGSGGASVPTSVDNVFIDSNSGAGTITISSTANCLTLDCTGYTGTLAGSRSMNVYGSFILSAGMTYTATGSRTFLSSSTGNVINTFGFSLRSVTFDNITGEWTLLSNLDLNTSSLTLSNGTLITNDFDLSSTNSFLSSSGTRTLILGTSTLTFSSIYFTNGANFILSANNASFICNTLNLGSSGSFDNDVSVGDISSTSNNLTINSKNKVICNNLSLIPSGLGTLTLNCNLDVLDTLTLTGNSVVQRLYLFGSEQQRQLNVETLSFQNIDICNISAGGNADWDLSSISGNSGDCGGNSGITFTSPISCYAKINSNVSWTDAIWFTTSGGSTSARIPLPQDLAIFDANSMQSASRTISTSFSYIRLSGIDFTGVTNTPIFSTSSSFSVFGDLILTSGMSITGNGTITFCGQGDHIFNSADLAIPSAKDFGLNAFAGSLTQENELTFDTFTITSGTWVMDEDISCSSFTISGGRLDIPNNDLSCSGNMTINNGSGIVINGLGGSLLISGNLISNFNVFGTYRGTVHINVCSCANITNFGGVDFHVGTMTMSGDFALGAYDNGKLIIGDGGMTCVNLTLGGTGSNAYIRSGNGKIICSGAFTQTGNQNSRAFIGPGGLESTSIALSNGAGRPYLDLGTGIITLTGTGTIFSTSASDLVFANKSTIHITNTSASTKSFVGGGVAFHNIIIDGANGNGSIAFTGNNSFNFFQVRNYASLTFAASSTTTVSKFLVGGKSTGGITITSSTTTNFTLSCPSDGIVACDYLTLSRSTAVGGATFYAGANSSNNTGNSGWSFTASPHRFWVNAAGLGYWDNSNTANWAASPGGNSGASVPTSSSIVILEIDAEYDASLNAIVLDEDTSIAEFYMFGFGIRTGGLSGITLDGQLLTVGTASRGNFQIDSTGIIDVTAAGEIYLISSTGTRILDINNAGIAPHIIIEGNSTWNLSSNLWCLSLTLAGGTFNANNYNIKTQSVKTTFESPRITNQTINMGNGFWDLSLEFSSDESDYTNIWQIDEGTSSVIINPGGSKIIVSNNWITLNRTFNGGGKSYGTFYIDDTDSSSIVITGSNTFRSLVLGADANVILSAGETTTIKHLLSRGGAGAEPSISSSTASPTTITSPFYLFVDYISLENILYSGKPLAYAGENSIDGGGNSGWSFALCPYYVNDCTTYSVTIPNNQTTGTISIPEVAPTAFLIYLGSTTTETGSNDTSEYSARVALSPTLNSITATRFASTNQSVTINIAVVNATGMLVKNVYHNTIDIQGADMNVSYLPGETHISGLTESFDPDFSAIFHLGSSADSDQSGFSFRSTLTILTDRSIRSITNNLNRPTSTTTTSYNLVEFNPLVIESFNRSAGSINVSRNDLSKNISLENSVDINNTIISFNGISPMVSGSGNPPNYILDNTNTVLIQRLIDSSTDIDIYYSFEIIEFLPSVLRSNVQRGEIILNSTTSNTQAITTITPNTTLLNMTGITADTQTFTAPRSYLTSIDFNSSSSLLASRNTADSITSTIAYEILDFNNPLPPISFRKTLSSIGTKAGSRQLHRT